MDKQRLTWVASFGLALTWTACGELLGIEDAHVDESLVQGVGGATSATGAGGDSATAGMGGSNDTTGSGGQAGAVGGPQTLCEEYCESVINACEPVDAEEGAWPQQ
jgi:hypothetical protein